VVEKDSKSAATAVKALSVQAETYSLMQHIQAKIKNDKKCVIPALEFAMGKLWEVFQHMVGPPMDPSPKEGV
jgi:hypothetical protein